MSERRRMECEAERRKRFPVPPRQRHRRKRCRPVLSGAGPCKGMLPCGEHSPWQGAGSRILRAGLPGRRSLVGPGGDRHPGSSGCPCGSAKAGCREGAGACRDRFLVDAPWGDGNGGPSPYPCAFLCQSPAQGEPDFPSSSLLPLPFCHPVDSNHLRTGAEKKTGRTGRAGREGKSGRLLSGTRGRRGGGTKRR